MPLMPCFKCNPNNSGHGDPACNLCRGKGLVFVGTAGDFHAFATGRMPVQITSGGSGAVALANDGTMWRRRRDVATGGWAWDELDPLPQPVTDDQAR